MASDPKHRTEVAEPSVPARQPVGYPVPESVRRVWQVIRYSGSYHAVIAATEVVIVTYLLSLSVSPAPLVIALVTFAVYANDRLIDLETDGPAAPGRTAFVRRNRAELYVTAAIAYGGGVAIAALGGPLAFGIALLPGVAWLGYAVNWLRVSSVQFDRLKEIPVISSVVVAGVWSLAVVGLPVAFADAALTPAVVVLFGYFFLANFIDVEVANVRDREGDIANGITTIPTLLGVARTRAVLYGLSLLIAAVLSAAAVGGLFSVRTVGILALGVVGLVGAITFVGRADDTAVTLAAEFTRLPVFLILTALAVL